MDSDPRARSHPPGSVVADEEAFDRFAALLAERGLLTYEGLMSAVDHAAAEHCDICSVLVQEELVEEPALAECAAEAVGVVALNGDAALLQPDALPDLAPRHSLLDGAFVPLHVSDDEIEVATADPFAPQLRELLQKESEKTPRLHVTTVSTVRMLTRRAFAQDDVQAISNNLHDAESASKPIWLWQRMLIAVVVSACVFAVVVFPFATAVGLIGTCSLFYALSGGYKLLLAFLSVGKRQQIVVEDDELAALDETALPRFTVLVPLYREPEVIEQLVQAMLRLDYPKNRLEVFLLLEEDDLATREAAEAMQRPSWIEAVVVPQGTPKGKPRALNYGLMYATGEFCGVWDAEDIPDSDQLKKAVIAFRRGGENVACVQCKLTFYNGKQNVLTNLFVLDYATWFELVLPGLFRLNMPIPLGGTSNHFRTSELRRIGGWDAYNVTEDTDLGTRLYRHGGVTVMVDSSTNEEANSHLWNWVQQRTRWTKGYMVTYLVHMRAPWQLLRDLGPGGFFSTQLFIGGTVLCQLLNPVFWVLLGAWYLFHPAILQRLFDGPILYAGNLLLFGMTFAFVFTGALSAIRSGHYYAAKYAVLMPFYWALESYATYRALYQLFLDPHRWEKTRHGLFQKRSLRSRIVAQLASPFARPRAAQDTTLKGD